MYNSILQFNELGIGKIEKIIKDFLEDSSAGIDDLVMSLDKPLQVNHMDMGQLIQIAFLDFQRIQ